MAKKNKIWVLTREVNEYNQEGEYFVTAWLECPSLSTLSQFVYAKPLEALEDEQILFLAHLRKGGGRIDAERDWFLLKEFSEGETLEDEKDGDDEGFSFGEAEDAQR